MDIVDAANELLMKASRGGKYYKKVEGAGSPNKKTGKRGPKYFYTKEAYEAHVAKTGGTPHVDGDRAATETKTQKGIKLANKMFGEGATNVQIRAAVMKQTGMSKQAAGSLVMDVSRGILRSAQEKLKGIRELKTKVAGALKDPSKKPKKAPKSSKEQAHSRLTQMVSDRAEVMTSDRANRTNAEIMKVGAEHGFTRTQIQDLVDDVSVALATYRRKQAPVEHPGTPSNLGDAAAARARIKAKRAARAARARKSETVEDFGDELLKAIASGDDEGFDDLVKARYTSKKKVNGKWQYTYAKDKKGRKSKLLGVKRTSIKLDEPFPLAGVDNAEVLVSKQDGGYDAMIFDGVTGAHFMEGGSHPTPAAAVRAAVAAAKEDRTRTMAEPGFTPIDDGSVGKATPDLVSETADYHQQNLGKLGKSEAALEYDAAVARLHKSVPAPLRSEAPIQFGPGGNVPSTRSRQAAERNALGMRYVDTGFRVVGDGPAQHTAETPLVPLTDHAHDRSTH